MNGVRFQVGPADPVTTRRLIVAVHNGHSHRDRIDLDNAFTREKFRENVLNKFGLAGDEDTHATIDSELFRLASDADTAMDSGGRKLVRTRMSEVTPREIVWTWRNRIAAGKVTLLCGDPGHGKSILTSSISATISRGWTWPDGAPAILPSNVIILSAEDGIEDTICPRLIAADADLTRIVAIQGVAFGETEADRRVFNLRVDMPMLIEAMNDIGNVGLVVVDPVSCYLDGVDQNKNGDVRSALQPLVDAAEQHRTAILMVTHLSKAGARSALAAATGSLAFGALARQAHLVVPDPDDESEGRKFFLCLKSNIGRRPPGMAYTIDEDGLLRWERDAVHANPDAILQQANKGERRGNKLDDAKAWLKTLGLDRSPMEKTRIEELATSLGHSMRTVERAFKDLDGVSDKHGYQGAARWKFGGDDAAF